MFVAPAGARNAYVANNGDGSVSVLNLSTGAPTGTPITVETAPVDVAITPNGAFAYVTNSGSDSVSVISTASNSVVDRIELRAGSSPRGIAISPDGLTAWVANSGDDTVSVIFTDTNTVSGSPIALALDARPDGIAISPDGGTAWVAQGSGNVLALNTATREPTGVVAGVATPTRLAIGPRGGRVFATGSAGVTAVNPANGAVVPPSPISIGANPTGIAVTPNGLFAYAAASGGGVTPVSTSTNAASPAFGGFNAPAGIAIAPDGTLGYVANSGGNNLSAFSTATNSVTGTAIGTGASPTGLAIVPNQGPSASFLVTPQRRFARRRLNFQAGASKDTDGTVANYAWDWGDGKRAQGPQTRRVHRYVRPGTYTVTLTVTDNEGCSNEFVFTGQTASCNGTAAAVASTTVTVIDPNGPVLRLAGGKRQRVRGSINVFAICPREACSVRARGVVTTRVERRGRSVRQLDPSRVSLAAGAWRKLNPRLRPGVRRAAARALRSGGKATAIVTVIAQDATGQRTVRRRTVKLFVPRRPIR